MARYYTPQQQAAIKSWLCELQDIIPDQHPAKRDRATKLVGLLDAHPSHPASLITYEFGRLRAIWRRLESSSLLPGER
ncbi:MAG: hypothetical protein ACM3JB_27045 [Acidobacteriaceae bacterium]